MDTTTIVIVVVVTVVVAVLALYLISRRGALAPPEEGPPGRLSKPAAVLGAALRQAWGAGLDDSTWGQIEEALLAADVGVEATKHIVDGVRSARPQSVAEARSELASRLRAELDAAERRLDLVGSPAVLLVVGVNGTGKTTTIAKLAKRFVDEGRDVLLAAADTFRAAAGEQLQTWGDRVGVPVVSGQEGGDPASVVYDALASARARGADVVIVDTAGRLHAKKNLMAELGKIHRVAGSDGDVDEVLLVLDATAGQNGLAQVRVFAESVPVTGIVLTKLDGTARGGIVVAMEKELGVPVKLVGVGEGIDDLMVFDPDSFVSALLEES